MSLLEYEIGVIVLYDVVVLLGNYCGDLVVLFVERLFEDENEFARMFGEGDLFIFECVFGFGGFDVDFEKWGKKNGLMFGMLDIDVKDVKDVGKNVFLVFLCWLLKVKFDVNKEVNDYDMEVFVYAGVGVLMISIVEFVFNKFDFIDIDYFIEVLLLVGKDDDECSGLGRVKLYFVVVRVVRVYIKFLNEVGKCKRFLVVVWYMVVVFVFEVFFMYVLELFGIDNIDVRVMFVEFFVVFIKAL